MSQRSRTCTLLLVFLLVFLIPFCVYADDDDFSRNDDENLTPAKLYSYSYEEGDTQASIHLHKVYAERGNVDLLDAFTETAEYGASLFISISDVKLYLTAKLVSEIAERGEPVTIYLQERTAETDDAPSDGEPLETDTEEANLPVDVVYDIDLGFKFEKESLKIRIKHKTTNADGLRVLAIDENGTETELKSSYGKSLVSFFPEEAAFTLRITEKPPSEGISKVLVLLSGILIVLVALSVVAFVLLRNGTLKRMFLRKE